MRVSLLTPEPLSLPRLAGRDKPLDGYSGNSFGKLLKEKINEVDRLQKEANVLIERFVTGKGVDLHQVMLATEKANLSLQLTIQVRNKLVEAYQEIWRMQV